MWRGHALERRPLPELYWNGETECTAGTKRSAITVRCYAHHIRADGAGNSRCRGIRPQASRMVYGVSVDAYAWSAAKTSRDEPHADGGAGDQALGRRGATSTYGGQCGAQLRLKQKTDMSLPFNALYGTSGTARARFGATGEWSKCTQLDRMSRKFEKPTSECAAFLVTLEPARRWVVIRKNSQDGAGSPRTGNHRLWQLKAPLASSKAPAG